MFAVKSMVHCGSAFEPGASGLPYYCTPPVCVPEVNDALAVWRHNQKKNVSVGVDVDAIDDVGVHGQGVNLGVGLGVGLVVGFPLITSLDSQ